MRLARAVASEEAVETPQAPRPRGPPGGGADSPKRWVTATSGRPAAGSRRPPRRCGLERAAQARLEPEAQLVQLVLADLALQPHEHHLISRRREPSVMPASASTRSTSRTSALTAACSSGGREASGRGEEHVGLARTASRALSTRSIDAAFGLGPDRRLISACMAISSSSSRARSSASFLLCEEPVEGALRRPHAPARQQSCRADPRWAKVTRAVCKTGADRLLQGSVERTGHISGYNSMTSQTIQSLVTGELGDTLHLTRASGGPRTVMSSQAA